MKIKRGYYYIFYKFYKLAKISPSIFPAEFVATVCVFWLEIFALLSAGMYYQAFINRDSRISIWSFQVCSLLSVLLFLKYFYFIRGAKWKNYVKDFSELSREKNDSGTFAVLCVIIFVLGNLMLSAYLRDKLNK